MALKTQSLVSLRSSDRTIEEGFDRVKKQALHWVFEGYPVGDYYEAALPGRDAFCMRDVSHQCTGAEVLGLSTHNLNMFTKFGQSISEEKDYCGHWEIDRYSRPCPVDYTNDDDFWYNLPANFDVLHACYRMYQWTNNKAYLDNPDLDMFFSLTMEEYIKRWDRDHDGLPDRNKKDGRRGLVSYDESDLAGGFLVGLDLVSVMARSYLSYASMCKILHRDEKADIYLKRGLALMKHIHTDWYDDQRGYACALQNNRTYAFLEEAHYANFMLYFDMAGETPRRKDCVDQLVQTLHTTQIEGLSHYPELLYRYGAKEEGMKALHVLFDSHLNRKEYPEASFCTIGAIATGLMGIRSYSKTVGTENILTAENQREKVVLSDSMPVLQTRSALMDTEYVELSNFSILGGLCTLRHMKEEKSECTFEGNTPIIWRCSFNGEGKIYINGENVPCYTEKDPFTEELYTFSDIVLSDHQKKIATFIKA